MTNTPNNSNQPKSKSFKNIQDMLNMDGGTGFDQSEAEREMAELEERKKQIDEFKSKMNEINKSVNVDDYTTLVLRELVSKGMIMLDAIQREVEDSARGRDVETAASMISALNSLIDNMNNIRINNARMSLEVQKFELKKSSVGIEGGAITNNQNILMVGSTDELMNLLIEKKLIPGNKQIQEAKIIDPPKIEGESDAN